MSEGRASRRELLILASGGALAALLPRGARALQGAGGPAAAEMAWHDPQGWGVEGRGWSETARYYDRLPARAEARVRAPVWGLSRHSAGMLVRFETDSPAIQVRYTLLSANLALPHMPATGVSGVDLYARDGEDRDRWLSVARPTTQQVTAPLASDVEPSRRPGGRLYTLYLPLYNGVERLEVGVARGAAFRPVPPRRERPLLFYGTSIMHGACASRPGMAIPAILGRRVGRPTLNLGFSGNGRMEIEVADLLAELDPAVYVIDCLPNMTPELVAERTEPLVRRLRQEHPRTPILLVEDRTFASAPFQRGLREMHDRRRAALRAAYRRLRDAGVRDLAYLEGAALLGADGEATTDGSHPNDLGMMRYADAYERALRRLAQEG